MIQIDISSLHPGAQRVVAAAAPPPMRLLAARGVIPGVPPHDALAVLVVLSQSDAPEIRATATATLANLPKPLLDGALAQELQAGVVHALADELGNTPAVLLRLLQMKNLTEDTLCLLARKATEAAGEIIATNEALILRFSSSIEALYMNKRVRMSTADRLIELAVRNKLELDFPAFKLAAQAIMEQLIPEPEEEPNYDDLLFAGTEKLAEEIAVITAPEEDVVVADDEGTEAVKEKFIPLFAQIQQMSITQKIRSATLGNGTMRMLLIRDTNRLVAEAAAKSPRFNESEATLVSASRAVSDEVLRIIATSRDLTKGYQVKFNLVSNPRTPFSFSSRFLPHLRDNDLKTLARSKNVPGAIVRAAKQALARKA